VQKEEYDHSRDKMVPYTSSEMRGIVIVMTIDWPVNHQKHSMLKSKARAKGINEQEISCLLKEQKKRPNKKARVNRGREIQIRKKVRAKNG